MIFRFATTLILVLLACGVARAGETRSYAIIIGNNSPPEKSELLPLKYADDDAVRYYQLFSALSEQAWLFTVLDERTQRRYPELAGSAIPPRMSQVKKVLGDLEHRMRSDRERGFEPVFYFIFSGHGDVDEQGNAYLSLLDGKITGDMLYQEILEQLPLEYGHLLIDACQAGGVVGVRGMFDQELDAKKVELTTADALASVSVGRLTDFPEVGVVIAAASNQEAHEWSRIESGVFTHELLSALAGPADVNGDGAIEYSEVHAFIAAANRAIQDPRALPTVIVRAPTRNARVPLLPIYDLRDRIAVVGDVSSLGHFYIELKNGQRYLDAHLGPGEQIRIAVPAREVAFVRTATEEAEVPLDSGPEVAFADLEFRPSQVSARGSIDRTFHDALFTEPFSVTYYKGFVDSRGLVGVRFQTVELDTDVSPMAVPYRKPLAIVLFSTAGAAAIASGISAGIALNAKSDFERLELRSEAHDANVRYSRAGTTAWIAGGVAVGLLTSALLVWPWGENRSDTALTAGPSHGFVVTPSQATYTLSW